MMYYITYSPWADAEVQFRMDVAIYMYDFTC